MGKPQKSVLPPSLRSDLQRLGSGLQAGQVDLDLLADCLQGIDALPPALVTRADRDIREAADLRWRVPFVLRPPSTFLKSLWAKPTPDYFRMLATTDGLERLFLFHGDGRLRAAALEKLRGGVGSSFILAAVALRLNDWADMVRPVAWSCLSDVILRSPRDIVAGGLLAIWSKFDVWIRWKDQDRLIALLSRPEHIDLLVEALLQVRAGAVAGLVRPLLARGVLDKALWRLAQHARHPVVRALAYEVVLYGGHRSVSAWEDRWIDKTALYGVRVPVAWTVKPANGPLPPQGDAMILAATDRFALVRKTAALVLIQIRDQLPNAAEIARTLGADRNKSVREMGLYVAGRLSEAAPTA